MKEDSEETTFYFYQLSTVVLNELGPEAGAVHAIINDHCRNGRYCSLSNSKIGNISRMSYMRVKNVIKLLLENGYIRRVDIKNGYGTNSYEIIPEKTENGLSEKEMKTLKSNDIRIESGREARRKFLENRKEQKR